MPAQPDALPDTMTAIEISEHGGPEVLKPVRRPVPAAGAGEVLIRVATAGVNRPDLAQRAGSYPPPPGASDLPGLEVAGEIVAAGDGAAGDGAAGVALGDTVCALAPGGGYAEYCAVPTAHCLPVPQGYDMVRAAALPETFFTVWTNVFMRGGLQSGETLLVHGGASGIGTTAIQIAAARGVTVIATAGTVEKCRACEELGAVRGDQLPERGFRRHRQRTDREQGRRRDSGHGFRRVCSAQPEMPRAGRPAGHHRPARRQEGRSRFRPADGEAADHDRLHAPAAIGRGQGGDRGRGCAARSGRCSTTAGSRR